MRLPTLAVLLLLASACSNDPDRGLAPVQEPEDTPPAPHLLRVATFNVNFGLAQSALNLSAIDALDADVVLLQETTEATEVRVRDALAERYPHMLFRACCRAGGLGVLSRFPISDETYLESTSGWFPAWHVDVETPLGRVQFLNVHLRPPVSDSGSWVVGYFTTSTARREEIEGFVQVLDDGLPTIIAGDFNEDEGGRAIGFLNRRGMRSALVELDPDATTWRWPTRVGELTEMLDHIVYDDQLSPVRAEVRRLGNSDHSPVVAEFVLANDSAIAP